MQQGKQTCKILKDIRRQIAEANDIEFITSECQYQGDCLGTCPRCEAELRYLEQQLQRRQVTGKTITIVVLSAGILTFASPIELHAAIPYKKQEIVITDSLIEQSKDAKSNALFSEQEKLPEFPGGEEALMEYLQKNIRYSEIDSLANSKYTFVHFTIDHDGQVIKPKINHEIHPLVDSEILRVISSLPRWKPGMLCNKTVQVRYNICFSFSQSYGMELRVNDICILYPNVYDEVPIAPEFPGGQRELMNFLALNIKGPSIGVAGNGVQGRTIIQFIVDKEGNILKPRVVRGVDPYLDKEALRVINLMPKWKPGELEDGTKVAVRFTVPAMFRLQ